MPTPICMGLLGGTFDPFHLGHLYIAQEILTRLPIISIQCIPCRQPPHRPPPVASTADRLAMIQLGIETHPKFSVNPLEIYRPGPSYTIDTLKTLHRKEPHTIFCFILGEDAWAAFYEWHHYDEILNYCHLIVVSRTESSPMPWPTPWLAQHETLDPQALTQHTHGKIFRQVLPYCPISATAIRAQLAQGKHPRDQLPTPVLNYIVMHHLYQAIES
ncbi:MAG: nicotinate (nicotinamide) nucleotide adenylyltransferase [Coxiella sp. RIFCSPHIGHO2_12_FULL_44_14]|nr:MAG: nicotinate (nicotinamide) nucleotide adenylyltransferase [Coxiella sp. RIFCSPHIGHO2_12_FULL_44_14]